MNEPVEKKNAGGAEGSEPLSPVANGGPKKPTGIPPVGNVATPPLPSVPIGKPGYVFKFDGSTPAGQEERREHERIRKADKRAAHRSSEPPTLSAPPVVDALQAPGSEQMPGMGASPGTVVLETFVPWVGADVSDFTDELVELAETKRIADFVTMAKEADMPKKFVEMVEEKSGYPTKSKAALKRCLADCAAKWLNKTGVSSKSKEEVKVIFCAVTIRLQGVRLKRDFAALIEADKAARAKTESKKPLPSTPATVNPEDLLK